MNAWQHFLDWWREHSLVALVITGGSLAGAIPKYVELLVKVAKWMPQRVPEKISRYVPSDGQWNRVLNARFGFAFSYPNAWIRQTSHNSDGCVITHPKMEKIEIRGWGNYVFPQEVKPDHERVLNPGYDSETYIEIHASPTITPKIDARRSVFEDKEKRFMQITAQTDGVEFSVLCSAPKRYFDVFEPTFLKACHSLAIIETGTCADPPPVDLER